MGTGALFRAAADVIWGGMGSLFFRAGRQSSKNALSRLGKWSFEPSPQLVEVTARRRARLLAMLLLPNSLHLPASAIAIRPTETQFDAPHLFPIV